MEKQKNKRSKMIKGIVILFCTLFSIYFGLSMYFINHFYFGSVINGINVSGKTVEEVNKAIADKIETYKLELEERENIKEEIKGSDIGLKYDSNGKIQELKDRQKVFGWIYTIFNTKYSKMSEVVSYDEELLNVYINKLSCLNSNNVIEPKNPSFEYSDNGYEIINEIYGNRINKEVLYNKLSNAILNGETKINLESNNCYENPKYTSSSSEVKMVKNMLNQYTSSKITYTFGEHTEVLDGSTISNWLEVDENLVIIFNEKKVRSYVNTLANTYNTIAKTRNFTTSIGKIVKVTGGNYGWKINNYEEVKDLIKIIKNGQTIIKEPVYIQKAAARDINDIGKTYVEINMTKQHLWFYKNGSVVIEGDVVTGNINNGCSTPVGTYRLNYKQKDATLKGENYTSNVKFWMPFNGGIGIHDASWRNQFGGNIYMTNGSHGCVNAPYYLANTIFNNIDSGTPIICYFE